MPASEEGLCRFVAKLAGDCLTIKSYLSGVRHLHVEEGLTDPFERPLHRLHYTLRGVKRMEGERGVKGRERLLISPNILRGMKRVWDHGTPGHDEIMLWEACCLAFFGLLRAGELTVPSEAAFDDSVHLMRDDLTVDNPKDPAVLRVCLKASHFKGHLPFHRKDGVRCVSSGSSFKLPLGAWSMGWYSIPVCRWAFPDKAEVRGGSQGCAGQSRS